jgi:stress response protein SCP2
MTVLSRGANAPLSGSTVDLAVKGARQGSVDLMVFQLGADHKVRSDADFVFFNQPASPEGAVRLTAGDRITADLSRVPSTIETLAVAVALDDAVTGSLAAIPDLGVTVTAGETHTCDAAGLTIERAAVLVEIYRRAGTWKVRNVSAGWAAGLPALVGEHGVSVDEAAPPVDPAVALPPAVLPTSAHPATPSGQPAASTPYQQPSYQQPAYSSQPAASSQQLPAGYPMPGGYPPPGGSLPPLPPIDAPRPGGWPPPGGSLG